MALIPKPYVIPIYHLKKGRQVRPFGRDLALETLKRGEEWGFGGFEVQGLGFPGFGVSRYVGVGTCRDLRVRVFGGSGASILGWCF